MKLRQILLAANMIKNSTKSNLISKRFWRKSQIIIVKTRFKNRVTNGKRSFQRKELVMHISEYSCFGLILTNILVKKENVLKTSRIGVIQR